MVAKAAQQIIEDTEPTFLVRLRMTPDFGYASTLLERSGALPGLTILDPFAGRFPNSNIKLRYFMHGRDWDRIPKEQQSWRKQAPEPEVQKQIMNRLDNCHHAILATCISGNNVSDRETQLLYFARDLRSIKQVDRLSLILQKAPHDREDKAHNLPDGNPVHNLEAFRVFSAMISDVFDCVHTPTLHSEAAENILRDAFGEANCHIYRAEKDLVAPIKEQHGADYENRNIVIMTVDGLDKIKVVKRKGKKGYDIRIPSSIKRALRVRNDLYPEKPYALHKDILNQAERIIEGKLPVLSDPHFDALPKSRKSDEEVEIETLSKKARNKIKDKHVIFIDDTSDTAGSVLEACRRVKEAGAAKSSCAVIYPTFVNFRTPKKAPGTNQSFTNALDRIINQRPGGKTRRPLCDHVIGLNLIANSSRRVSTILTTEGERKRFTLQNATNFMIQSIVHCFDQAAGRALTAPEKLPVYRENGKKILIMPDGTEIPFENGGPA